MKLRMMVLPWVVRMDSGWNCILGGVVCVPQAHRDSAWPAGGDEYVRRQRVLVDDQRVVASGGELLRQAGQHAAAVVGDGGGLAVGRLRRGNDAGAVGGGDHLVPEADA